MKKIRITPSTELGKLGLPFLTLILEEVFLYPSSILQKFQYRLSGESDTFPEPVVVRDLVLYCRMPVEKVIQYLQVIRGNAQAVRMDVHRCRELLFAARQREENYVRQEELARGTRDQAQNPPVELIRDVADWIGVGSVVFSSSNLIVCDLAKNPVCFSNGAVNRFDSCSSELHEEAVTFSLGLETPSLVAEERMNLTLIFLCENGRRSFSAAMRLREKCGISSFYVENLGQLDLCHELGLERQSI